MGWISVGIRLSFLAAFCLLWLNQEHVNASGPDPIEIPKIPTKPEHTTAALAQHILEKLYEERHEPFLKELGKLLGNKEFSPNEQKLGADFIKAFESKDSMRRYMIEYIMNEMAFQTIAVGLNGHTKTVVIAGNIKAFDFWNLAGVVKKKKLRITRVAITDVGFRPSDYKIIQDIVAQEYPNHKVVVVQPSDQDLQDSIKDIQDVKGTDRQTLELREQAQAFHAEMQVQNYFEHNGGLGEHEVTIVASKQYCVNCWENLVERKINVVEMEGRQYCAPNMRWKEPNELTILHSQDLPDTNEVDPQTAETTKEIEMLEESGGACTSTGGGCTSLEDFTEVDAEEFHKKIQKLPTEERQSLLFALEKIGRDKLSGSLSAMTGINNAWKRWKITIAVGVIQAVRQGTIVFGFLRGNTRTFEPERTAISPSILAESLNLLHETEIESLEDEHERYQTEELEEGRKSFISQERMYNVVKKVNLAMVGKNLIGAAIEGDWVAMAEVGGLFIADRQLDKLGELMVIRGTKLFNAGRKILGTTLRIAGPVTGGASIGFGIYCLFTDINELKYTDKLCQGNHTIMPDGSKNTCKFDHDIAIANVVSDAMSIIAGVALIVEGILTAMSISTGPAALIFAAVDVLVAVGVQVYAAVESVAKINSLLVGGLTGWEKFKLGVKAFFQVGLPPDIVHLLDIKKGYNIDVNHTQQILQKMENFQSYVGPTTHTRSNIIVDGLIQREFEENSEADFQVDKYLARFRVEPDTPDWGTLECKPNMLGEPTTQDDPEYAGIYWGFLCHNVIALAAPGRPNLPVLVDLKNGTDEFFGAYREHVFLVEEGTKQFYAGPADDVFLMKSQHTRGILHGGEGTNTLVLEYDQQLSTFSPLVLENVYCSSLPPPDWKYRSPVGLWTTNFQQLVGRANKSDSVVIYPGVTYIDLHGGESASQPDKILIEDCEQYSDTTAILELRQFTSVDFNVEGKGNFVYKVELGPGIQVDFKKRTNAVNQFVFSNDIVHADLSIQPETFVITNSKEGSKFQLNGLDNTGATARLMSAAGLVILFEKDDPKSIYGYAAFSNDTNEKQDLFVGLVNHPNHFVINTSSTVNIQGGDKDDTFILTGTKVPRGRIHGNGGVNSLVINQDFNPAHTKIDLDLRSNIVAGEGLGNVDSLSVSNIANVIGRLALPEQVNVDCNTKWLDLRGGQEEEPDIILIPDQLTCASEMTLMVGKFTTVENKAPEGTFNYRIDMEYESQTSSIKVHKEGKATHNYIFMEKSTSITNVQFNPETNEFQIKFSSQSWKGIVPIDRSNLYFADRIAIQVFPEVRAVVGVGPGSDTTISGINAYPNLFILEDTTKACSCNGGQKDDTFLIGSENFSGEIFGDKGNNSIVLADGLWNGSAVIFDGIDQHLTVKNQGTDTEYKIVTKDIQRFFGRVGQPDVAYPGCDTSLIDTRGGGNASTYDLVYITPSLNCDFDLGVAIQPNLIVINDAREGEFQYEGDFRGGDTSVFLTFSQNADHNVYLAMDFAQLEKLDLNPKEGRLNMTAKGKSEFSIDFFIPFGEQTHTQPTIAFQDGLQLKVSRHGGYSKTAFGVLQNVSSSEIKEFEDHGQTSSLVRRYQKTAKDTRTNVVMEVEKNTLLSIGSGGRFEILTAIPGYEYNVLVCNDANETVYRIANGTSRVAILVHPDSKGHKVLDLTPIAKERPGLVPSEIRMSGTDVHLSIQDVLIWIQGQTTVESLENWQVLLRETCLNFKVQYGRIELVPKPFVVDPKKQDTVVLNTTNLERNTEILTVHDPADPIEYQPARQGRDLVFTNLFQNQTTSKEVATVVFADYFIQEDVLSKNVVFEKMPGQFYQLGEQSEKDLPTFEQLAAGSSLEGPAGSLVKDEL